MTTPHRKVQAAGGGGSLAIVLVVIAGWLHLELSPVEAAAFAAVLSAALGYVVRSAA